MSNFTEKTPYFIFKPKILKKNYEKFEKLCKKYLKKYVIAYSVKTNSFEKVIETLNSLWGSFEVASLEEIDLINKILRIVNIEKNEFNKHQAEASKNNQATTFRYKRLKVNNQNIINNKKHKLIVFNGCCKTKEELKIAIENKFLINVDSKSEIDKIAKILNGEKCEIGLRISLEESKFGFELERLEEIINYCKKNNLKIICLSFHEGTKLNVNNYKIFIENADKVIFSIKNKVELKYIDFGGGFPDNFQLKNLGVGLEDYFKLINKLKKFNLTIILEPGRVLVSDAFDLITKVNVIKQNFGKNYAVLDAGINVLSKIVLANYRFNRLNVDYIKPNKYNVDNSVEDKYVKVNQTRDDGSSYLELNTDIKNKKNKEYILTGPLLFKNDILGKFFGVLNEGDLIKIENVGAYCYNLAWEISYEKPKILIDSNT